MIRTRCNRLRSSGAALGGAGGTSPRFRASLAANTSRLSASQLPSARSVLHKVCGGVPRVDSRNCGLLLLGHGLDTAGRALFPAVLARWVAGVIAGFGIGVVASLLGVAGGELLIPTIVLLFGVDNKLAGSLSLAVSLPTMLVGFARYSRDSSFAVVGRGRTFVLVMAAGSIVGVIVGGQILGIVPRGVLLPLLTAILLISAVKVWRHA